MNTNVEGYLVRKWFEFLKNPDLMRWVLELTVTLLLSSSLAL